MRFLYIAWTFVLVLFQNCSQAQSNEYVLSPEEFAKGIMEKDVLLVDVRTKNEFDKGAIEGAVNWDIKESDFISHFKNVPLDKKIYVYCASGMRSAMSASELRKHKFENVFDLKGGYSSWIKHQKQ